MASDPPRGANVGNAVTATLEVDDGTVELTEPRLIAADEAFAMLPSDAKRPPSLLKINEFLAMRRH